MTWFAWVSALAGSTSGQANILLGLVSTNFPDTYEEKPWHITVLIVAQVLIAGLINTYAFRAVPWMELCAGMLHIALWVIFIAVLLAPAPKSSAEFVFFGRTVSSGWDNGFVSWNLGLLVPAWGFIGFDGVTRLRFASNRLVEPLLTICALGRTHVGGGSKGQESSSPVNGHVLKNFTISNPKHLLLGPVLIFLDFGLNC